MSRMDEELERRFYDFVTKSEDMEPLRAMKLLTKACMDYGLSLDGLLCGLALDE